MGYCVCVIAIYLSTRRTVIVAQEILRLGLKPDINGSIIGFWVLVNLFLCIYMCLLAQRNFFSFKLL